MNYYNLNKTGGEVDLLLNAVAELQASAVRFTLGQGLDSEDQTNARVNIGAVSAGDVASAVSNQIGAYVSSAAFTEAVNTIIANNATLATIEYVDSTSRPEFVYVTNTTEGNWASNKIYVIPMNGQNKLWVQTKDSQSENTQRREISVVQNAVSTYTPDGCMVTFTPNGFSLDKTALDQTIWSYKNGYLTNQKISVTETAIGSQIDNFQRFFTFLETYHDTSYFTASITVNVTDSNWTLGEFFNATLYGNGNAIYYNRGNDVTLFENLENCTIKDLFIYLSSAPTRPIFASATATNVVFENIHIYCNSDNNIDINELPLFCATGNNVSFKQCSINIARNRQGLFGFTTSNSYNGFFIANGADFTFNNCLLRGIVIDGGAGSCVFFASSSSAGYYNMQNNIVYIDNSKSTDFGFFKAKNGMATSAYSAKNLYAITTIPFKESQIATGTELVSIRGNSPPSGSYLGQIMYDSTAKQFLIWNGDYWQQIT